MSDEKNSQTPSNDRFAASLIRASAGGIAGLTAEEICSQDPTLTEHPAIGGIQGLQAKLETRLTYLATALSHSRSKMFSDNVAWTRLAWQARGIPTDLLATALQLLGNTVGSKLPPEAQRAAEWLHAAASEVSGAQGEAPSYISLEAPRGRLAAEYFMNLLEGRRRDAIDLVLAAVDDGMTVKEAYLDVVLPVLQEIGRGWVTGEVSIGEEHFSTSATEALLARLQERVKPANPKDHVVVGAALENNDHDLGLRMVTDFFEMDGWRSVFLGSGMPVTDLVQAVLDFEADLLAISISLSPQLEQASAMIQLLRSHPETRHVPVIVGGSVFRSAPDLYKDIGANALADGPEQAVAIGNQLLSQ